MKFLKILLFLPFSLFAQDYIAFWKKGNEIAAKNKNLGLVYYQKAAELAHNQKNWLWEANVHADLCGSYYNLGDHQAGIKAAMKGVELLQKHKINNDSVYFKLYSSIAPCYQRAYQSQLAVDNFEKAGKILDNNPLVAQQSPLFATYYYLNYSQLLLSLYDTEKARHLLQKSLRTAQLLSNPIHYRKALGNLSNMYVFSSEYGKSIELYLHLIQRLNAEKPKNLSELAKGYFMLGYCYSQTLEYEKANHNYQNARKISKNLVDSYDYYNMAAIDMAENYLKMGKTLEVESLLKLLPEKANNTEYQYYKNLLWSNYYLKTEDFQKSIKNLEQAFNLILPSEKLSNFNANKNWPNKLKLFEIFSKISKMYYLAYLKSGKPKALANSYENKKIELSLGSQIRKYQENLDSKIFFTDKYHKSYKEVLKIGVELLKVSPSKNALESELFLLAEEAKALIINDPLTLKNQKRDLATDSLLLKLQANQAYLSYLKSKGNNQNAQEIIEYENTVDILWTKIFKANNNSLAQGFPKVSATKKIPNHTAYLNYFLLEDEIILILKTNEGLSIQSQKIDKHTFFNQVNELKRQLKTPPAPYLGFGAGANAEYLFNILVARPFPDFKKFTHLIVNPDNAFFDVSFDILINPSSKKYLIETHAISYSNSLNQSIPVSKNKRIHSNTWAAFFPFSSDSKKLISGLKPLKFSLADVKGVKSINSLDKQATKSSFLTALQSNENGAVMIATHAANDNEDPYLLFDTQNRENSKLFASEIRHYKVSCPLVVLSACATHQGKTYEGLGSMSFAKTIEWAGGSSVAATLWEVDDQSMSVLTSLFYKFLAEGLPKDVAMQNAKLAYLKTPTGKANDLPFYWAHFQVIGDTEPLSEPTNYLLLYLSAVFISLLFLYFFRLKIKLRN